MGRWRRAIGSFRTAGRRGTRSWPPEIALPRTPAHLRLGARPYPPPKPHGPQVRCWHQDGASDPLILRLRLILRLQWLRDWLRDWLRHRGELPQAHCLAQELEPLF